VDERRIRFVGHVLHLSSARPVSAAVQWMPEGGTRRRGRPRKTWQDTLRDDPQAMDVSWEEDKSVAGDRKEWMEIARRPVFQLEQEDLRLSKEVCGGSGK